MNVLISQTPIIKLDCSALKYIPLKCIRALEVYSNI